MATDRDIAEVLSEFARTMVTDFSIQAILDQLVVRIVDIMPIGAAGVTLISEGAAPHYVAASDDAALRYEQLQTELDEGPCLLAYRSGLAVSVPDLSSDERFPTFGPKGVADGLGAAWAFPLCRGDERLGALDLYQHEPGDLGPEAMGHAQTLADVASAYLANAQARAELEAVSERSHHTSLHDDLTGLPNRTLLLERIHHALLATSRSSMLTAIIYVDLDGFKAVNDSNGHRVGDRLLVAVAKRLTALLRPGDTLARMSGDEFVIVCVELAERSQAGQIADRVIAALAVPFSIGDVEVEISASAGVAFADLDDPVADRLLDAADAAMYRAKRSGGHSHVAAEPRSADGPGTLQVPKA